MNEIVPMTDLVNAIRAIEACIPSNSLANDVHAAIMKMCPYDPEESPGRYADYIGFAREKRRWLTDILADLRNAVDPEKGRSDDIIYLSEKLNKECAILQSDAVIREFHEYGASMAMGKVRDLCSRGFHAAPATDRSLMVKAASDLIYHVGKV